MPPTQEMKIDKVWYKTNYNQLKSTVFWHELIYHFLQYTNQIIFKATTIGICHLNNK